MSVQLTANLLSKLAKNVHRKHTTGNIKTKKSNDPPILNAPPRKCFDPCTEFQEISAEMNCSSSSSSSSSACEQQEEHHGYRSSSPDRTSNELTNDDEDFYQTLNRSEKCGDDAMPVHEGEYDYLASYEWPTTSTTTKSTINNISLPKVVDTPPLPPPASTQPSRTQAILKFYDYY